MLTPINIRPKARMADRSNGISTLKGRGMSALGQKQTFAVEQVHVRFVPEAGLRRCPVVLLLRASASLCGASGFCSVRGIVRIGIAKPTIARQHIRPTLFY